MHFDIADTVTIKNFSVKNKAGGTLLHDDRFGTGELDLDQPIEAMVIKEWHDYETGQRGWAIVKDIVMSDNPTEEPLYKVFSPHCMTALEAVTGYAKSCEELYKYLDEGERASLLEQAKEIEQWVRGNSSFHNSFILYISEHNVISRK